MIILLLNFAFGAFFSENMGKCELSTLLLNFSIVTKRKRQIWYNSEEKLVKFNGRLQNSKTVGQFFMFHDLTMTIFIFQVFSLHGNPVLKGVEAPDWIPTVLICNKRLIYRRQIR